MQYKRRIFSPQGISSAYTANSFYRFYARMRIIGQEKRSSPRTTKIPVWLLPASKVLKY